MLTKKSQGKINSITLAKTTLKKYNLWKHCLLIV